MLTKIEAREDEPPKENIDEIVRQLKEEFGNKMKKATAYTTIFFFLSLSFAEESKIEAINKGTPCSVHRYSY